MKTKLNDLLEFPTSFTFKVIGLAEPSLINQVIKVVERHIPGYYTPKLKISNQGNYHSISITIVAAYVEQIEILYDELSHIKNVFIVI